MKQKHVKSGQLFNDLAMEQLLNALQLRGDQIRGLQEAVHSYLYGEPQPQICACLSIQQKRVFDTFLIVGLKSLDANLVPYLKYQYPAYDATNVDQIGWLCFPDSQYWTPTLVSESGPRTYQLVVTSLEGDRRFAYCRRIVPPGSDQAMP